MLTYSLQWVVVVTTLVFALLAFRIASRLSSTEPFHAVGWRLTGWAFLFHFVGLAVQNLWGGLAMMEGAGSRSMVAYLRWAPALNHSRTFVLLAFCLTLVVFAVRAGPPGARFWPLYLASLALAALTGAGVGLLEGRLVEQRHYLSVAGWDTVELVAMLVALLSVLVADRVDRLLWGALAVYAFSVALSILWFTALSRTGLPGAWAPAAWHVAAYRAAIRGVVLVLAWRRLRLVLKGARVPGMSPLARQFRPATLS